MKMDSNMSQSSNFNESEDDCIPRPLHQAAVKQLIGAMAPGEVLCRELKPENCKNFKLDFTAFPTVIRGGVPGNLVFYPDGFERDLGIALQYPQHCLITAVGVEDRADFLELARKSGPGAAYPKSDPDKRYYTGEFYRKLGISPDGLRNYRATRPWTSLRADRIEEAAALIPDNEGTCAANSQARALVLAGVEGMGRRYQNLTYYNPPEIKVNSWGMGPWDEDDPYIPREGPSPWELIEDINIYLPMGSAFKKTVVSKYESFRDCASDIESDIESEDPVIAFFVWDSTTFHYANVVAVKRGDGLPTGFMLLETDGRVVYRTYDNMKSAMYNHNVFNTSFYKGDDKLIVISGRYNIIRFVRK